MAAMTEEERSAYLELENRRKNERWAAYPESRQKALQSRREYLKRPEVAEKNKQNRLRRYRELSGEQKRRLFDVINGCRLKGARRIRENERWKSDPVYKLGLAIRNRLNNAIRRDKGGKQRGQTIELLGCSIPELKAHLESLFQPDMGWNNWRVNGWHIDHKKPLSSFDLSDAEQLAEACHYTNLQPLWATENLKKGCKIAA